MNEPRRTERVSQDALDATGGVSHVSEAEAGPVRRVHEPEEQLVEKKREDIRAQLAVTLTVFFGATLVGGFALALIGGEAWTSGREYLQLALTAVTGLLGSVIGFYFGSQR